ncbi:TPA: hypothetical protein BOS_12398 [Bos taurus]|nr:TPA: hypothetical protein BOS_12398 [Bos taurus]
MATAGYLSCIPQSVSLSITAEKSLLLWLAQISRNLTHSQKLKPCGQEGKKKNLLHHHFRLAGPANVQIWRKTYGLRIRPHNAQAHGEAPPPRAPAEARAPEISPPLAPPGASAPRPDGRRSRLAPARTSGDGRRGKNLVTLLPFYRAAQAPALGAAAPSGAESLAARRGGARPSPGIFQRKCGLGFRHSPSERERPELSPCRVLTQEGHRKKTTFYERGREPSPRTKAAGALILDFQRSEL